MIIIKSKEEIEALREGGRRLAGVLHKVKEKVRPGITTQDLNDYAHKLITEMGDTPAFLRYRPEGAGRPYPASICISVNDEVVHGIPTKNKKLKEGDIVSLDLGLKHAGLFTDMAMTVPVGAVDGQALELLATTEQALYEGIKEAKAGQRTGDIGFAVENFVRAQGKKEKYGIVEVLSGHGVGRAIHEDPYIPNFGKPGRGEVLQAGMVVAIEPMLNEGSKHVVLEPD